jgi:AcrR family transcriptional regulator
MTLYRNFGSKDELALAFLRDREERWTHGWLQAEAMARGATPAERLLAIFDVFGEWFRREDYEGCAFITGLLELDDRAAPVRVACARHLENIRTFVRGLAVAAGVPPDRADGFARQWHILMKGSIVAAAEGDRDAAGRARELGELLLARDGVAP